MLIPIITRLNMRIISFILDIANVYIIHLINPAIVPYIGLML